MRGEDSSRSRISTAPPESVLEPRRRAGMTLESLKTRRSPGLRKRPISEKTVWDRVREARLRVRRRD